VGSEEISTESKNETENKEARTEENTQSETFKVKHRTKLEKLMDS
jgi:hypothetical protein